MGFSGFNSEFFEFFHELKSNNDRDWFHANKGRYQEVVIAPLQGFVEAMAAPLSDVSDCFVADPRLVGGSIFRIYRDVRFSRDKRPFKEHAACQFRHIAGKDAHAPGFYVHIGPGDIRFGGGIWQPPAPVLLQIRQAMDSDPDGWLEIVRAPAFRRRFGTVLGDGLKRAPKGFDPDHSLIEDLRRKSFFAMERVGEDKAGSSRFVSTVARSFEALGPFMEFLTEASGKPYWLDD